MSRTLVAVDPDLLSTASEVLGTHNKMDTSPLPCGLWSRPLPGAANSTGSVLAPGRTRHT